MDTKDTNRLRAIAKLRVNVKSLAAEAKIIRSEVRRWHDPVVKNDLSWHRKERLREEARTAHLALAAVRGTPYQVAESKASREPDWRKIIDKVCRASHQIDITKWLLEAKAYYAQNTLALA